MKTVLVISIIAVLASLSFAQDLSTQELRDLKQAHREFRINQAQNLSFEAEMKALKKDAQARAQAQQLTVVADHGFTDQEIKDLRRAYRDFRQGQTQVLSFEDEMKSLKKDHLARSKEQSLNVFANDQ